MPISDPQGLATKDFGVVSQLAEFDPASEFDMMPSSAT
jgi:hypothetical protein